VFADVTLNGVRELACDLAIMHTHFMNAHHAHHAGKLPVAKVTAA